MPTHSLPPKFTESKVATQIFIAILYRMGILDVICVSLMGVPWWHVQGAGKSCKESIHCIMEILNTENSLFFFFLSGKLLDVGCDEIAHLKAKLLPICRKYTSFLIAFAVRTGLAIMQLNRCAACLALNQHTFQEKVKGHKYHRPVSFAEHQTYILVQKAIS